MSPHRLLQPCLTTNGVCLLDVLKEGEQVVTKVPGCRCDGHVLGKRPLHVRCAKAAATTASELCQLCHFTPQTQLPDFRDYPGEWIRRFFTCGECWGCPAGPLPCPGPTGWPLGSLPAW